jgi:hypothetical protein
MPFPHRTTCADTFEAGWPPQPVAGGVTVTETMDGSAGTRASKQLSYHVF